MDLLPGPVAGSGPHHPMLTAAISAAEAATGKPMRKTAQASLNAARSALRVMSNLSVVVEGARFSPVGVGILDAPEDPGWKDCPAGP